MLIKLLQYIFMSSIIFIMGDAFALPPLSCPATILCDNPNKVSLGNCSNTVTVPGGEAQQPFLVSNVTNISFPGPFHFYQAAIGPNENEITCSYGNSTLQITLTLSGMMPIGTHWKTENCSRGHLPDYCPFQPMPPSNLVKP